MQLSRLNPAPPQKTIQIKPTFRSEAKSQRQNYIRILNSPGPIRDYRHGLVEENQKKLNERRQEVYTKFLEQLADWESRKPSGQPAE